MSSSRLTIHKEVADAIRRDGTVDVNALSAETGLSKRSLKALAKQIALNNEHEHQCEACKRTEMTSDASLPEGWRYEYDQFTGLDAKICSDECADKINSEEFYFEN